MIYFAQEGWKSRIINKLKDWKKSFNNQMAASAIIEVPAVMTAAGQKINRNGQIEYNHVDDSGVKQLRSNLQTIGEAAVAAPTLAGDVEATYQVVRHPVQTAKAVVKAGKEAVNAGKQLVSKGKDVVKEFSNSRKTKKITVQQEGEKPSILGPKDWLIDWNGKSGVEETFSSKYIKREFSKAKQDILNYVKGDEFKERVMNSGQFTDQEYPILISELEKLIKQSKFAGKQSAFGATNIPVKRDVQIGPYIYLHRGPSHITISDYKSPTQLRADLIHEIFHSIGGHNKFVAEKNPLITKLRRFNEAINPTTKSDKMKYVGDDLTSFLDKIKKDYPEWYSKHPQGRTKFATTEVKRARWLEKNLTPEEVRSRMASTLDRLRTLGYDTKELLKNPDKFRVWINEIKNKGIHMPYDTQHLLMKYNIRDLGLYASRMLSTTGSIYTGNKIVDKNK